MRLGNSLVLHAAHAPREPVLPEEVELPHVALSLEGASQHRLRGVEISPGEEDPRAASIARAPFCPVRDGFVVPLGVAARRGLSVAQEVPELLVCAVAAGVRLVLQQVQYHLLGDALPRLQAVLRAELLELLVPLGVRALEANEAGEYPHVRLVEEAVFVRVALPEEPPLQHLAHLLLRTGIAWLYARGFIALHVALLAEGTAVPKGLSSACTSSSVALEPA
mmetsp:Transcript_67230/g.216915  ORF Transcript_67230/g.216915 Transcript_67230/m.216915 type:complete len:222 (-) Transcript_67230:7-672(-)